MMITIHLEVDAVEVLVIKLRSGSESVLLAGLHKSMLDLSYLQRAVIHKGRVSILNDSELVKVDDFKMPHLSKKPEESPGRSAVSSCAGDFRSRLCNDKFGSRVTIIDVDTFTPDLH